MDQMVVKAVSRPEMIHCRLSVSKASCMTRACCHTYTLKMKSRGCSRRSELPQYNPMQKIGFPAPTEIMIHENMGELRPAEIWEYEDMGELRRQRTGGRWSGGTSELEAKERGR